MKPEKKLIIVITMPSGQRLAVGGHKGSLALIPIEGPSVHGPLVWFESEEEAQTFMDGVNDRETGKNFFEESDFTWHLQPIQLPN